MVGFVNIDPEVSVPVARARDRVKCSLRCTGRMGLCLRLEHSSDVRVTVRLNDSITVRHA